MARILLITAALYVVLRSLVVLALGDVFFYGEELEKGAVASMLLQGVDVPYARLPYHPYEGGGFVASHLKAVMFMLVGPCVLAHKLAALLWGLLVLSATVALAWRHAGRGAAWLAGLLLILGPAHLQKQSLLHLGIHYEALLFIALVLDLGLRVAATPKGEKPRTRLLVGLGLAAGFGTYFSYQVPTAVLAVILLLARTGWRRVFAPPLVIATLVGLLPLALMALAVGGEIVDVHGANVGAGGGWSRLVHAIVVGTRDPFSRVALVLGAVAFVAGFRSAPFQGERGRAITLLAGFALLWMLVAIGTGMVPAISEASHWVSFVRFAPLVFALLLLVALSAGPALERAGEAGFDRCGMVARFAALGLMAVGGVHTVGTIREGDISAPVHNLALIARASGVEFRGALVKIAPRLNDPAVESVAERAAKSIAPFVDLVHKRSSFLAGELAAAANQNVGGASPDEMLDALVAATNGRFERGDLARGIGFVVRQSIRGDVHGALSDSTFAPHHAEALGRFGTGFLSFEPYLPGELASAAGTPLEVAFLRGLGHRVFRCSVMQAYWGPELRLHKRRARARLQEGARSAGTGDAEIAALLDGFDDAARDFGLGPSTLER